MAYKTNLVSSDATFASMMENGFGIITVMNAKVYNAKDADWFATRTAYAVVDDLQSEASLCELDTLKIANVTEEGPTKTITGGKYSNALIKFGKSARLEMQDALGNAKAIDALCGGIREWSAGNSSDTTGLHFGEDFQSPKTIIGESFFIDRNTGKQVDVNIVFYQFLPDSIFNLTQDAEGDASVFDMNGDLLTTEVKLGTDGSEEEVHGIFYSIIPARTTTSANPDTPTPDTPDPEDPTPDTPVETTISPDWDSSIAGWEIAVDIENTQTMTVSGPNNEFIVTGGTTPAASGSQYAVSISIEEGDTIVVEGADFVSIGGGYTITVGSKNRSWSSV